ncbi:tetratricopeptide repeat protein 28-like [Acropora muricata]|uniref:tetratricopeptide repeat protein 28-like n=1 Tax=Acropora muricata TaxID=159855 RepID=UPI0034E5B161
MDDQELISHGRDFQSLDDYQKAIEYQEKRLKKAIESGDRDKEGAAYRNLGSAFHSLSDHRKAIVHHEKALKIAIEIGDRGGEGRAYGNLGSAFQSLSDYPKAIEYHENALKIAIEIGDRGGEGKAYGNLGSAFQSLSDYRKNIEYQEKRLNIAIEIGDRGGEGGAYGNLGNAYDSLGDSQKAIEYHKKHLKIAREVGNLDGEGKAYGNLGNAYQSVGDYRIAIEYNEKALKLAVEVGDRAGEGRACGSLGSAYRSLGDYRKAIDYHKRLLKIAIEIGDRAGEGGAYGNLGNAYHSLGDYRRALEYHEKLLKIAKEIGDRAGEGEAYHNIGNVYSSLEQFENAVDYFVSAVDAFNSLRSLLKSQDNWKVTFREQHETTYTALWRSLIRSEKFDEALFAAEQGRAQTLSDNLLIQYKLPTSLSAAQTDTKATISLLIKELSTPTIFLATEGLTVYIWFLRRENKVAFRRGRIEADTSERDPIQALLQSSLEKMGAEDRVRSDRASEFSMEARGEGPGKLPLPPLDNPLKPFYDAFIDPVNDMLGPQDDELLIVPNGALGLTPWAAVIESMRIRTVPSLTSYQLILSAPEGYHKRTGVLLVGNPCLKELKRPLDDLPCAQEEVEMIASFFNTRPLTGREATKAEVMKRMSSVGLIHIASHGNARTGEIALSPNPGWASKYPQTKDYILKMSDVQAANLRARLVVLSCAYSGRGRILKGEGVVGIARAFLSAGARSVLVALWAIDDGATKVFMKSFYQLLREGKTASAAVHQSMKSLRESEEFSEMKYWAPFQLIGDDVKIEFEAHDDVNTNEGN